MREPLGFILANALMLLAGSGVLAALGIVGLRARELVASAGLALMTGVAAVILAQILLLVLGVAVPFRVGAAVALLIAGAGFAVAIRRRRGRGHPAQDAGPVPPSTPAGAQPVHDAPRMASDLPTRLAAGVAAIAFVVFTVSAYRYYTVLPADTFDDFAIWSKKAYALVHYDTLVPGFHVNYAYSPMHQEYPILFPQLEAFVYRGMGTLDNGMIKAELLVLFLAFVWALAWLIARGSDHWFWLPVLLALAVSPFVHSQLATGYADITMASFAALGALCVALWLDERRPGALMLGALLLGAAANIKFEGLMAAAVTFVVAAGAVVAGRELRRLGPLAAGVAVLIALVAPWRLWVAAHPEITSFFSLSKALDVDYLTSNLELPGQGLSLFAANIADDTRLLYLVPLATAMAIVAIVSGWSRRIAFYYVFVALGVVAGIVFIYWVDPTAWSPHRVVSSTAMIAIVGLLHLSARLPLGPPRRPASGGADG